MTSWHDSVRLARLRRAADLAAQLADTANVFPDQPWGPWDRAHPVYNLIHMSGPRHWLALADLLSHLAADGATVDDVRQASLTLTDLIIVDDLGGEPTPAAVDRLAELRRAVIAGCGGGAMLYDKATALVDQLITAAR